MFHVTYEGTEIAKFVGLNDAKRYAEHQKELTGHNYIIERREWVWSTQTLAELDR